MRSLARLGGFTRRSAFTLIELLTVMTIIAILAGLIIAVAGFAQKKGALSRAAAEIKALENGCESYKADTGTYPHQPVADTSGSIPAISSSGSNSNIPSDLLFPGGSNASGSSAVTGSTPYTQASLELYEALTGDVSCTGTGGGPGTTNYIADMKPDVWGRNNMSAAVSGSNAVFYLSDPFGNSYGYSTAYATAVVAANLTGTTATNPGGYNPTYDLWSTGGNINPPYKTTTTSGQPGDPMLQWVTNWR